MPNASVHVPASATAGVLYALRSGKHETQLNQLVEGIGGAIGGGLGGRLPDQLDPPLSPRHRAGAHSAALAASLVALGPALEEAAEHMRALAKDWDAGASSHIEGSLEWLGCRAMAFLVRLLVGLLNGLYAGYLCHLGLDCLTPASIPAV